MPNPWKRRSSRTSSLSRLLSSLRPKRPSANSPLLVQTGFPTSLADLVVKHRSRSRRKNTTLNHNRPSLASRVSDIISVLDASENHSHHSHHHHQERREQGLVQLECLEDGSTQKLESTHSSGIEAPQDDATVPREEEGLNLGSSRGLDTQAKVVLVMVLVVCTRELVLGVMFSAFLLLLLEFLGGRLVGWTRQRGESKEVEHFPSLGSEKREFPNWGFDLSDAVSQERCDLGKVVSSKAKRRQWAKVMLEKFRHLKRGKDAKESVEEGGREEGEEVVVVEGECEGDDPVIGQVEKKWKSNGSPWILHLLLVVVLFGLVGGKVVAIAITVVCCYLMRMGGFIATKRRCGIA